MKKPASHKDLQDRVLQLENELEKVKSEKNLSILNDNIFYNICEHSKNAIALYETKDNGKNFIIKYLNEKTEELEQKNRENAIGKNILDVFPQAQKSGFIEILKKVYQNSTPEEFSYIISSQNKFSEWKQNYIYKISDTELVSTYIDETEYKHKEFELIEHREKLQIAMEAAHYYPVEITFPKRKITVRKGLYLDLGYNDSEIESLMQKTGSLIHAEDFKKGEKLVLKHSQKIEPSLNTEFRIKHKNGNWIWFTIIGKIIDWNNKSEPIKFVGLVKNIQEEKEILIKIQENESRLKLAMKSANQALVDWDIKKDQIYFSPEWYKMLEYNEDEVTINYDFTVQISHPEDVPAAVEKLKEYIAGKTELFNVEIRMKTKSGKWKWISTLGKIVKRNSKGDPVRAIGVQSDITEQKKLISDLSAAKEKAEESDKLKSAFLANMSHEIRTPMNGILGFAELLKDDITDEEKSNYLKIIDSNGKQLLSLINDIIEVAKIEAGEVLINKTEAQINPFLEDIYQTFYEEQKRLKKQTIEFSLSIPDRENDIIHTDIARLQQILNNLLSNAFKFTESGAINFGYKIINSSGLQFYQFFVSDTGIGISEDMQEYIFERFGQVYSQTYKNKHGTGLGLAITKGLLNALDGKIWVESKLQDIKLKTPGYSTFYFTIPIVNDNGSIEINNVTLKTTTKMKSLENINILIVEDDADNLEFLRRLLHKFGANVSLAKSGEEAIEQIKENDKIKIVLMDIRLPNMNGFETTQKIKALKPTLPVIAQTAYAMYNDKELCLQNGCDDYISKPLNKDILFQKINQYIYN